MSLKAAIYHFTDKSDHRPIVYKKQLGVLKEYAASKGYDDTDIFCDMTLKHTEHTEFNRFLKQSDQYDALITKDFYHIAKNTGECMKILQQLKSNGIQTYTLENGAFSFEDAPTDAPLSVATYCCNYYTPDKRDEILAVQNEVMELFIKKRTKWTLKHQYFDIATNRLDNTQVQLHEMIRNRQEYDLILVHKLIALHWRTAKLCKIRQELHMDIHSLQDGFLKYTEE